MDPSGVAVQWSPTVCCRHTWGGPGCYPRVRESPRGTEDNAVNWHSPTIIRRAPVRESGKMEKNKTDI